MPENPIVTNIQKYILKVQTLPETADTPDIQQLLTLLILRDNIMYLTRTDCRLDVISMTSLIDADNTFREYTKHLTEFDQIRNWRESINPCADAWWWFPERSVAVSRWEKFDLLFGGLTLLIVAVTLSFVSDIASRFYSNGIDFLGALTVALPIVLTSLSAGSILSNRVKLGVNLVFQRLNIALHYRQVVLFLVSFVVLLTVFAVWQALPSISVFYNNKGMVKIEKNQLGDAKKDLERAISLNPENAVARYNLGDLYEMLFQYDKAISEYQFAALSGHEFAQNNLSRLFILKRQFNEASQVLLKAISSYQSKMDGKDTLTQYNLLKNLGWARAGQGRFGDAISVLNKAVELLPERAPGHCLLGKSYSGIGEIQRAAAEWEICINLSNYHNPDEDRWITEGRAFMKK
jgi:Tfp pilus assembly protein PilF